MADITYQIAPRVATAATWASENPTLGKVTGGKTYGGLVIATSMTTYGTVLVYGANQTYAAAVAAGQFIPIDSTPTFGLIETTTGLKFPATQVPSADANTLDDYEEGAFTPVLSFGGAAVGITYGIQAGVYLKVGNHVFFDFHIALTSKGTSTGDMSVAGLPFTTNSSTTYRPAYSVYATTVSYTGTMQAVSIHNSANVIVTNIIEAGTVATLTNSNFGDTSILRISGTYAV